MSSKAKTTGTKGAAKLALVPKLRFPEFREAGAWKFIPLKNLADRGKNKNRDEKIERVLTNSAEFGVVDQRDFFDKDIATQGKLESYVIVELGDYVYNPRISATAPVGPISKNNVGTGVMSPLYTVFRFKDPENTFYQHYFKTTGWHTYLRQASSTGARHDRMAIGSDDFMAMPLPVPSASEQQKIAECLSSLDEVIAAQARKVDALKTHKKGLMQQLFPREGETQPRLRFPEFQGAREWSEGRIADIATVLQGYGFPERHQGQASGDYPFYKVSDISRSLFAGKVFIEEATNYINESLLKELRAKPIPEGTTIFAKIGEAIRSNKRAITTVPCLIDNNAAGVKRIKGKATDFFIYLLMEQISLIDHAGGVVPAVNKSAIEEIVVKFPEPDEQERIASCLSSLDALITAETQKLEALKRHKRGLMQQLFPSLEGAEV